MQKVKNLPSSNRKKTIAEEEGWFDDMEGNEKFWAELKIYPIENRETAYSLVGRYRKRFPDYEWATRQISETRVAIWGREKS
jgi:hypothetical protein